MHTAPFVLLWWSAAPTPRVTLCVCVRVPVRAAPELFFKREQHSTLSLSLSLSLFSDGAC